MTAPTITAPTASDIASAYLPDIASALASAYRAAGKSPRTIEAYGNVLRGLSAFLTNIGRTDDPDEIKQGDIEDWVVFNRTTKSAVTARSYYLTAKACWGWMRRRGLTTNDPFKGVETPVADERVITILTDDDVRAIIATTTGPGFTARRDRALFHLAADSGLRRGEMAAALLSDLDLTTGRLLLRGAKSNHDRVIPLSDKTRMEMRRWLKERERLVQPGVETLFTSRTGEAMTGFGIHRIFATRAKQAGVHVDRPVHGWRAWFAVTALANGANESAVMHIAGWHDASMLRRYTRGRAQELALKAHTTFSPMDRL